MDIHFKIKQANITCSNLNSNIDSNDVVLLYYIIIKYIKYPD